MKILDTSGSYTIISTITEKDGVPVETYGIKCASAQVEAISADRAKVEEMIDRANAEELEESQLAYFVKNELARGGIYSLSITENAVDGVAVSMYGIKGKTVEISNISTDKAKVEEMIARANAENLVESHLAYFVEDELARDGIYSMIATENVSNGETIIMYGIKGRTVEIPNISTNKAKIEEMIARANAENLAESHLAYFIEDEMI